MNYPFKHWPEWADAASKKEGWILTNDSSERVTISRLDDPSSVEGLDFTEPKFQDDQEAYDTVACRAEERSPLHLLALWLQGYHTTDILEIEPPSIWEAEPS